MHASQEKKYLQILSRYILDNPQVTEWHLWQNCRTENDRNYVYDSAKSHHKIRIIEMPGVDGTNRSVNKFYKFCNEPDTFYIKADGDIVYIHPKAIHALAEAAKEERGKHLYWSPIVINNAICTAILAARGQIVTGVNISAQAGDRLGWGSPLFAKNLHLEFLRIVEAGAVDKLLCDYRISLGAQRFSINCIGFWGESVMKEGENFCPETVDDEEWISAILPIKLGLSGRVVGMALVSHYSSYTQECFYTQEWYLNKTEDFLTRYARLVDVDANYAKIRSRPNRRILTYSVMNCARDFLNNVLGIYTNSQRQKIKVSFQMKNEH